MSTVKVSIGCTRTPFCGVKFCVSDQDRTISEVYSSLSVCGFDAVFADIHGQRLVGLGNVPTTVFSATHVSTFLSSVVRCSEVCRRQFCDKLYCCQLVVNCVELFLGVSCRLSLVYVAPF